MGFNNLIQIFVEGLKSINSQTKENIFNIFYSLLLFFFYHKTPFIDTFFAQHAQHIFIKKILCTGLNNRNDQAVN